MERIEPIRLEQDPDDEIQDIKLADADLDALERPIQPVRLKSPRSLVLPPAEPIVRKQAPTRERSVSVGGFVENLLDDAYDFAKGVFQVVPATYRAGKFVAENLGDPGKIASAAGDLAVAIKDAIVEPYRKHGAAVAYHRPLTTLLDLLTVVTLGGGGIARAGKLAGGISRAKITAAAAKGAKLPEAVIARLAGPSTSADKLVELGERIQRLPGVLARRGIDKTVLGVSGGKWDLAKRREFLALKAEELAQVPIKVSADMETVGKKIAALSDEEAALWHRWRTQGATKAELAAAPKVAEALEAYRGLADEWTKLWKSRGLLSDYGATSALLKKYAAEIGGVNKANIEKAVAAIRAAEVKPIYGPAIFEGKGAIDLEKILTIAPRVRTGKVGFLEEYKGVKGAITDPRVYVPKAIKGAREVEARLRLAERLLQSPHLTKNATFANAFSPSEQIPEGIFRKYFDDRIRAQAVQQITDPTIRRLLQWEYTKSPGGILRFVDAVTGAFRKTATVLNPRWYLGNAVGDAFLGELAGANWLQGRALLKKGAMPPQVAGGGGMHGVTSSASRLLEKASEIGNQADIATRAGIISRSMAQDLKNVGVSGEALTEAMDPFLRSTKNFSDVQVELQLRQEQLARGNVNIQKADIELARLLKREHDLADAVDMAKTKNVAKGLAPAVEGAPISIGPSAAKAPPALGKGGRPVAAQRRPAMSPQETEALRMEAVRDPDAPPRRVIEGEPILISPSAGADQPMRVSPGALPANVRTEIRKLEQAAAVARKKGDKGRARELYAQIKELEGEQFAPVQGAPIHVPETGLDFAREMRERVGPKSARADAPPAVDPKRITGMERDLEALRQRITNLDTKRDLLARDLTDNAASIKALEERIPGLREQNAIARDAVSRANAFLGDYLGMDGFEQGVARRLVPFYAWSKAMTMLAFRLPFLAAPRAFAWNRYAAAMMSLVGDNELPEYMQGYIPIFARESGDTVWLKLGSYSPFGGLRQTKFGDVPIPNLLAVGEQNPLISLGYRMLGGKTLFEPSKVPYGEPLVNISNGDVYEFTKNGMLRKTIPQTPLIQGVAHMFPLTQLIEDVLSPFSVTKYDWWGFPQPVYSPDGTLRYPREWFERLGALGGIALASRGKEDAGRSEKVRVRQAIRGLRSAYRRADADEREYLRTVLADYGRGEYRRIEAQ